MLFQVHFLALLLEERGAGDLAQVAEHCIEKLIRRHPHVFGDVAVDGADAVRRNWDEIKRTTEGRGAAGLFADVPENLPALSLAAQGAAPRRRRGRLDGALRDAGAALLARLARRAAARASASTRSASCSSRSCAAPARSSSIPSCALRRATSRYRAASRAEVPR